MLAFVARNEILDRHASFRIILFLLDICFSLNFVQAQQDRCSTRHASYLMNSRVTKPSLHLFHSLSVRTSRLLPYPVITGLSTKTTYLRGTLWNKTFSSFTTQSNQRMSETSTQTTAVGHASARDNAAGATSDHLLKLGEDVFLLESEKPTKHDPDHPDVGPFCVVLRYCGRF